MTHSRLRSRAFVAAALASWVTISNCTDYREPTAPNRLAPSMDVQANASPNDSISDRYIVIFKPHVTNARGESDRIIGAVGGKRKYLYQHIFKGFSVGNLAPGAIKALRSNPNVASVEHVVYEHVLTTTQNIGSNGRLWGLDRIDQRSTVRDQNFTYAFNGQGVRIYVLDTGIDPDRAEFEGRVSAGTTMVGGRSDGLEDPDGHGTGMASLAGGSVHGTAKAATLIPVRVGNDGENIGQDQVVAGFDWIYANGIAPAVVTYSISNHGDFSCQLFGEGCNAVRYAVQGLWDRGIVTVHAAGNDGNDACSQYVNRSDKVIVAGATAPDAIDGWPWFANYGGCVTLEAPGLGVGFAQPGSDNEVFGDGTSISAPLIAGVIAQILQERPTAAPDLIKTVLRGSATPIPLNLAPPSYLFSTTPDPKLLLNSWHRWASVEAPGYWVYTDVGRNYTWNADRLGGDGTWTYEWWVAVNGGAPTLVSTAQSFTRFVNTGEDYWLYVWLYATSAGETVQSSSATRFEAPGCGQEICP